MVAGVIQVELAVIACVTFTVNVTPLTVVLVLFLQTPDEEHAQYWWLGVEVMLPDVEVITYVSFGFKRVCVIL